MYSFSRGGSIHEMQMSTGISEGALLCKSFSHSYLRGEDHSLHVCECRRTVILRAVDTALMDFHWRTRPMQYWDLRHPVRDLHHVLSCLLIWNKTSDDKSRKPCLAEGKPNSIDQSLVGRQSQTVDDQKDPSWSLATVMGAVGQQQVCRRCTRQKWDTSWRTWPSWANKLSQIEIFSLNISLGWRGG